MLTITGVSDAQAIENASSMLLALADRKNVIACDVLQENNGWTANDAITRALAIMEGIRSAGVTVPLTCSTYDAWTSTTCKNWVTSMSSQLDFLDFHVYAAGGYDHATPLAAADLNYWLSTYPTLDILCGEHGKPESETLDPDHKFSFNVFRTFDRADTRVRGALMWCAFDQDTVSSNKWGIYASAGSEKRFYRAQPIAAMTGGYIAKRN